MFLQADPALISAHAANVAIQAQKILAATNMAAPMICGSAPAGAEEVSAEVALSFNTQGAAHVAALNGAAAILAEAAVETEGSAATYTASELINEAAMLA
ncbi:PE domain-containing protein [Mycobacteroides abscessus]|uniref:PE family n=1 Tax=Mycobacteroides abscessus TaxID=36809 RepID=A0A0U0ZRC8_9MYCO|nr:PE domain-containing protein [Mycobacteroides abscessus]CPV66943.1 PE family [Mycobacteroides abscessus]